MAVERSIVPDLPDAEEHILEALLSMVVIDGDADPDEVSTGFVLDEEDQLLAPMAEGMGLSRQAHRDALAGLLTVRPQ